MIVIIGAGVSGIAAANRINQEYIILEKKATIGGLSSQYLSNGYRFEFGGHYFHFNQKSAPIKTLIESFADFKKYRRNSKVFFKKRLIPFPIQFHLAGLPKADARRILSEILASKEKSTDNLHDFLITHFGSHLFKIFFQPFLEKYYHYNLQDIASTNENGNIPIPSKTAVEQGFAGRRFTQTGYNSIFFYPTQTLEYFINSFARSCLPNIRTNEEVVSINWKDRTVHTKSQSYRYDYIISSIPLNRLVSIMTPSKNLPEPEDFKFTSTLICNVALKKRYRRFGWVYLPEAHLPFYRAGYYPNRATPTIYLERNISHDTILDPDQLHRDILKTLTDLQMVKTVDEILHFDPKIIDVSHIIFDKNWQQLVPPTLSQLASKGIYSTGRYGRWTYSSMSDDIQTAINTADIINQL